MLEDGTQRIKGIIPGKYFEAFSNIDSVPDKITEDEMPSVVFIKDLDCLVERILQELKNMGIHEDEIIVSPIKYYDFNQYGKSGWFDLNQSEPKELFIKDKSFENQSEIRIVVNSKNDKAMEHLRKTTINIGNIEDIASNVVGYFKDGIRIEMDIDMYKL